MCEYNVCLDFFLGIKSAFYGNENIALHGNLCSIRKHEVAFSASRWLYYRLCDAFYIKRSNIVGDNTEP